MKNFFIYLIVAFGVFGTQAEETRDLKSLFGQNDEFLDVDDAFSLSLDVFDNEIIVEYKIAPTYYMYQHRLKTKFAGATQEHPLYPDGKQKVDEYFGEVRIYTKLLQLSLPYQTDLNQFYLELEFQGCAEAGLCYPPTSRYFSIDRNEKSASLVSAKDMKAFSGEPITTWAAPDLDNQNEKTNVQVIDKAAASLATTKPAGDPQSAKAFISEKDEIINSLNDSSLLAGFFLLVALGIGLAFTPCVFPMMPIISSIIAGQGSNITTSKAFLLSLTYTQAMAIPYVALGVAVSYLGAYATALLQSPPAVIIAAIIFVILAIGMFGFFEIQLPSGFQNKLNNVSQNQSGGTYIGAGIMGFISALVVSPCVTIPLIAVLTWIAQQQDMLTGAVYLYGLAVGMGIPLIIIGVGGGKLLPRAGVWMDAVKAVFGVIMLGVALYITKHLIPGQIYLLLWAAIFIVSSVYMGALRSVALGWETFWKGIGILLLTYGVVLVIGAAQGNGSLFSPLKTSSHGASISSDSSTNKKVSKSEYVDHAGFILIKSSADLDKYLAQAKTDGKTVMLDYFAEYCVACYEFAELTFPDPRVQAALENTILLQADVTKGDELDKELMERFKIFGLPSILFFDQDGRELSQLRAEGFEDADQFLARIDAAIGE